MASNYDEVVRKNKDYLTQAQINALAAASREYNIANAGNRASALASAREQYDAGMRGLQNMGLAGNPSAAPASGEVPRLQMQIKTPFDQYNERLRQVENRRLGQLGEQFKQETIAERQRQAAAAEEARQAQLRAAAEALRLKTEAVGMRQTAVESRGLSGSTITSDIKRQRNVNMTDTGTNGEKAKAVAAANKNQADGLKRTQTIAAAELYGISSAVNAAQDRGAKLTEQLKGSADTSTMNRYAVDENARIQEVMQAARTAFTEAQKTGDTETQAIMDTISKTPKLAQAFIERNSASPAARKAANTTLANFFADETAAGMGYEKPKMTDSEFSEVGQRIPDVKRILRVIDAERSAANEGRRIDQAVIDEELAELKRLGYTEQQARQLIDSGEWEKERWAHTNYGTWQKAWSSFYEHEGEKPAAKVNTHETDPVYRAVNNLPDLDDAAHSTQAGTEDRFYTITEQQKAKDEYGFVTDYKKTSDQYTQVADSIRNSYNAIYEQSGVSSANEYLASVKPIIEMQSAANDKEYLEKLTEENPGQAWALARFTNLVSSVPAMLERLSVGVQNQAQNFRGGYEAPVRYSPDSAISRTSNWADTIQSKRSQDILDKYKAQGREGFGKVMNFLYQTGTSMADSAVAMALTGMVGSWASDVLFFSSAGNQAYRDTIDRGGTQEQAMAMGILSGTAEALFEHVSIEHFMENLKFNGPKAVQLIKSMLSQGGTEASEEVCTEIANILSDALVMGDKSEIKAAIENGELGTFLADHVGMATLGGLASGLGFGAIGMARETVNAAYDHKAKAELGKGVKEFGDVDQMKSVGVLLGGDSLAASEKVEKSESNANVGSLTVAVQREITNLSAETTDQKVSVQRILDGAKMTEQEAGAVLENLGEDTVKGMGYDTSSPAAFAASYNERVEKHGITSRAERMAKSAEKKFQKARESAANRVWANPEQGLAYTTKDGATVTPMPGNMTAVALAEQERTGFKTRASATKGSVTYAVAGMETREGLTNGQAYDEIQNGLTKEARRKAELYERLSEALGVKMVIHDVMVGTNGFIDENGKMHVVLSGRQSVLRVAAHELTHYMKDHASTEYVSLRDHLIAEVGQDKFDRMVNQKAREYGLDLKTDKGKTVADDEVCAELCERMLSNEEALEKFAEKDTEAAKTLRDHLLEILNAIKSAFKRAENRNFGDSWSDLIKSQDTLESWVTGLQKAVENAETRAKTTEGQIAQTAGVSAVDQESLIEDVKDAKTDAEIDNAINEHSVDVIAYDLAGYMQDLERSGVMSKNDIQGLMDTMNKAIDKVMMHRAILDFGPMLSEEAQSNPELAAKEVKEMKEGRAYLPYKQNADPHYKLALDFSTLCRKRVLLQSIQERLQAKLGRALSQEETVAIRLELQNLQKNNKEEFGKIEVACALCYVEAARLKSPKVINAFLNNTKAEMQNYFAKKNPATKDIIEGEQQKWKVKHVYAPDATKSEMSTSDVTAFNNYSRSIREQFESDNAAERVTVDRATRLTNGEKVKIGGIEFPGRETFLSASWLEKLKGVEPDIFYAFTDKVRSATRSKAQETDTFYARRDIDMVTEGILNYANAESGFRHQSWSDFVPTHLLDTMAAVIEMSTRKAKMHAYTKVPAMVRLLGKTGMMLNMSLIPAGNGLDENGNLIWDSVEGMPWGTMLQLRRDYANTAGNIAIGVSDEQIKKLLDSRDIDYVIPYHASGMNKNMRGYMDIKAWAEYTSSQNEKSNHRGPKGKSPELAEWFNAEEAAKAEDGYAFMRAASEKYLKLCADNFLVPKFSQYLQNNGDGSYSLKEGYENYWKLLIDRKMVNQATGKVIIQQAVKPTFDQGTVLGILENRITDPAIQQQAKAADLVAEKFSDWQANKNNASAEAIAEAKKIRDRSSAITAQKTAEALPGQVTSADYAAAESNTRYSLADEDLANVLDDDEMVPVYRAMQVIDGKLYPPMAAKVKNAQTGKATLAQPTELGKWYVSDERPDLIDPKTGKWKLDKGNKSSPVPAAYNPYFHTSLSPLNDQFSSAYNRPNLVVVEGYVPKNELTSGYKAQYAKDPVGAMRWHSGPVSSHLSTPRTVILSRYFKANRILSDAEVASKVADLVKGENVSIPQNTVTPGLYSELQKIGVPTTAMHDLDTDVLRRISTPTIEEQVWAANDSVRYSAETGRRKEPGYKPEGKEPRVRDVRVPERANTGNPVSDFARSFLESDKATDEMVADLQERIKNGDWGSYTRLTNKEATDQAKDFISRRTLSKAQEEFHDMVKSGRYNVQTRAIGLQLLAEAAQRGDSEQVLNIATDLRELATDAGQSVQIFSALKELGGVGSAWYMQKKIDSLNAKYADKIAAGKMNEITVDADLMQDLIEAKTTAEIEAAEDEIAKAIAKQLPLTWESRISNWRYLAMLGNPTTHFRNITGNVFMAGLNMTKDAVATMVERLAVKDTEKRTHAVLTGEDRRTWGDFADKSYEEQKNNLRGSGKFGFESQLRQYMRAFDTKWLNKLAQFNFGKLEQEDMWFIKPAYRNALMQYMKAQGYTLNNGVAGKTVDGEFKEITKEQMTAAQEWATNQAWKATFHDASALASMLNNASRRLGPVGNMLIEGVMPFKKTPINIAKRGVEYSPAGIVLGVTQLMKDVRTGKVTTAEAIDNIASGITGSALMAMGAVLAKMGLIRSGGDDNKKKDTYLTDTGDQTYALKFGDVSIDISALAPSTIPLFMGAALYDALSKNGEGLDLSALTDTVANTLNPFMEMSFMSSLNSALKNYSNNGIGGALGNTLLTAVESYGSQFLPTAVAKAGQLFDPVTRTTKSSAASPLGSNLDYYIRSLAKKVPGLEATLEPDVNVWGRTTNTMDSFGRWALDAANKFILPVTVKIAQKDAVDNELIRLVESTGNVDILPSDGPKYFTVKGEKYPMTAAQYTEYSQDRGYASYAALKEAMNSDAYADASDEEKSNMLQNALSAAQKQVNTVWKEKLGAVEPVTAEPEKQQTEVKSTQGDYSDPALYKVAASYPTAYDKAAKAKAKGISPDTFLDLYEKKDKYSGEDLTKYTRQQIMNSNLSVKQKEFMDDLIVSDKGRNPDYSSQTWFDISMINENRYEQAKEGTKIGLKPETYLAAYNKFYHELSGDTKQHDAKAYLDSLTISAPVYDYLWYTVFRYSTSPAKVK